MNGWERSQIQFQSDILRISPWSMEAREWKVCVCGKQRVQHSINHGQPGCCCVPCVSTDARREAGEQPSTPEVNLLKTLSCFLLNKCNFVVRNKCLWCSRSFENNSVAKLLQIALCWGSQQHTSKSSARVWAQSLSAFQWKSHQNPLFTKSEYFWQLILF